MNRAIRGRNNHYKKLTIDKNSYKTDFLRSFEPGQKRVVRLSLKNDEHTAIMQSIFVLKKSIVSIVAKAVASSEPFL